MSFIEDIKQEALERALVETGGNRTKAAALLGISLRSVRIWIQRYNLKQKFPYRKPWVVTRKLNLSGYSIPLPVAGQSLSSYRFEVEAKIIEQALNESGSVIEAARIVGLNRAALETKIKVLKKRGYLSGA